MTRIRHSLIIPLLLIAYLATSIGPRGAALCLGGGHEWSDVVAARCEHGGHSHRQAEPDHVHETDLHQGVSTCAGCEHHQSHEHGPCTDIPLDGDEGRPSNTLTSGKSIASHPQDPGSPVPWSQFESHRAIITRPQCRNRTSAHAPGQVTASLRAVILLI